MNEKPRRSIGHYLGTIVCLVLLGCLVPAFWRMWNEASGTAGAVAAASDSPNRASRDGARASSGSEAGATGVDGSHASSRVSPVTSVSTRSDADPIESPNDSAPIDVASRPSAAGPIFEQPDINTVTADSPPPEIHLDLIESTVPDTGAVLRVAARELTDPSVPSGSEDADDRSSSELFDLRRLPTVGNTPPNDQVGPVILPGTGSGRSDASGESSDPSESDPAEPDKSEPDRSEPDTSAGSDVEPTRVWPYPAALLESLEPLSGDERTAAWVDQLRYLFEDFSRVESLASPETKELLEQLDLMVRRARGMAAESSSDQVRSDLLRAAYSIARRTEVWERVRHIAVRPKFTSTSVPDPIALTAAIRDASSLMGNLKESSAWRDYMRLAELETALDQQPAERYVTLQPLAVSALLRAHASTLTPNQLEFVAQPEIQNLLEELKPWAVRPVDYVGLLNQLENYERQGSTSAAHAIAEEYQQLKWAESPRADLAEYIDRHYRNANLRVAISDELINRLMPASGVIHEDVNDVIAGARVSGRSRTVNGLRVILVPDRLRWRLGLEARGRIASETQSRHGPALFFTDGLSRYRAEKVVVVDKDGVKVGPTQVRADSSTDLTGLQTEFDPLPLIGMLARAVALNQHDQQIDAARSEAEWKVEGKVRRRFDQEVEGRLREAEERFQDQLLLPLQRLRLDPTIVDLRTTGQRLIARYRLAGYHQLAAHTARPQAPSDSLLSMQLHQSAVNNLLENLNLDGRRVDLAELIRELGEQFQSELIDEQDLPEDVTVHFANEDAVRVDFAEDRITLTMRLIELSSGSNRWRYFIVRGHYKPDSTRLDARLARDGHIELAGKRLSFRDQVALRAIFCKVMDKNRTFALIGKQLSENPKVNDLRLTQCRVSDGWVGLAAGPRNRPGSHPDIEMAELPSDEESDVN